MQDEVAWKQREVTVHGKLVMQPRLVAYMADDPSLAYTYSRQTMVPDAWSPVVNSIKVFAHSPPLASRECLPSRKATAAYWELCLCVKPAFYTFVTIVLDFSGVLQARLEEETGAAFNSCLLNLYRNGRDHMSWHSDNEVLYGPQPVIGSVSFGEARDFVLRHNSDHSRRFSFSLGSGDMLTMQGTTQDHWMHAVPKRAHSLGTRVNLTFRKVVRPEALKES